MVGAPEPPPSAMPFAARPRSSSTSVAVAKPSTTVRPHRRGVHPSTLGRVRAAHGTRSTASVAARERATKSATAMEPINTTAGTAQRSPELRARADAPTFFGFLAILSALA